DPQRPPAPAGADQGDQGAEHERHDPGDQVLRSPVDVLEAEQREDEQRAEHGEVDREALRGDGREVAGAARGARGRGHRPTARRARARVSREPRVTTSSEPIADRCTSASSTQRIATAITPIGSWLAAALSSRAVVWGPTTIITAEALGARSDAFCPSSWKEIRSPSCSTSV